MEVSYLKFIHDTGKLTLDEKENSNRLPEKSEFCNVDREDGPVTKQGTIGIGRDQ